MNIFVAKLSFDTDEEGLREVFENYGEVKSVKIILDKSSGRSKGFGFIEMPDDDEALEAIERLHEYELNGREIVVKKSIPREDRRNLLGGPHGGDGGGGGIFG